jgi:hypothetical protein
MSTYRVDWPCGEATETECWEPTECPICEADNLRTALREVLGWMTERGHPGKDCLRSGWIDAERVEQLRRLVGAPSSTEPTP